MPAWDDHLLPNGQASSAINGYLFSGALTGWRLPKLLHRLNNSSAQFAYRIPRVTQGTASNTLTVNSPTDGDKVTIGSATYTLVAGTAALTAAYTVLIGTDNTSTAANLLAAVTLDQGADTNQGVLYGNGTSPNPDVSQANPPTTTGNCRASGNSLYVEAPDIGVAYNATVTTETTGGARLSWAHATLSGGTNATFDSSITGDALWLEYLDPDTTVLRSPVVNDQYNRYYTASPSQAPTYNTYDRIAAGQPPFMLGLNPPGCAPEVTVTAGGNSTTLGLSVSTSTNTYQPGANTLFLQPITPTEGMSLNDCQIITTSSNPVGNYTAVLYEDNSGVPGQLLATGLQVTGSVAGTPIISTFVNPPPLTANIQYWIGFFTDDASATFVLADDAATLGGLSMATTYANGPPEQFELTTSGFLPVHVVDATSTYINIDTPLAGTVNIGDNLVFGPAADGYVALANTVANIGDTQILVTYASDIIPTSGTVIYDQTAPSAMVGQAVSGSGAIPDIQMWGDLTTSSVIEGRAYVYTWVTEYDEESAPSPATVVNGWSNGIWSVMTWSPTASDMGVDRNIDTIRLYRTVPSTTGSTVFYWVCDINIATNTISNQANTVSSIAPGSVVISGPGTVNDTLGDDVVALNNQLESTTWFPPPESLEGLYSMPNGMMVGFRGNEIWFCEPYRPHAWPPGYVVTTEFPIVGLGVSGLSVVAATTGTPYVMIGTSPSAMSSLKLPNQEPCISRGSVMGTASGVYYASQKGLIQVNPSGAAVNTTELWITREKWAELTPLKNVRAVLQSSCYFAFGTVNGTDNSVAQEGYTIELNIGDAQSFTIWPQPGGHRVGFGQLTAPNELDVVNIYNDPWTGITCLIQDGNVNYYDFTDAGLAPPKIQPYTWKSKIYQQKAKDDFSAMRVFFTVPPGTPPQNETRNTAAFADASWNTLDLGQYGIIYVYADGNLITVREIVSNGELLRIASGQKFEQWQWEVQARVIISNIQVATTVKELKNV